MRSRRPWRTWPGPEHATKRILPPIGVPSHKTNQRAGVLMSQASVDSQPPQHLLTYHTNYTTPNHYITYTGFMTRTDYISRTYCIAPILHTSCTSCIYSMVHTLGRPYTIYTISNRDTACMVHMASISAWFTLVARLAH